MVESVEIMTTEETIVIPENVVVQEATHVINKVFFWSFSYFFAHL